MIRRPPRSTRTDTLFPYTTLVRSHLYLFQRTPSAVDERGNRPTDPVWVKSLRPGWQTERMWNFYAMISGKPQEVDLVNDGWTRSVKRDRKSTRLNSSH